jgi:hypothetical protein
LIPLSAAAAVASLLLFFRVSLKAFEGNCSTSVKVASAPKKPDFATSQVDDLIQ